MFAPADPTDEAYSAMAIRFTRALPELGLESGLYIYQLVPDGHLDELGVQVGDILVQLKGKNIRRIEELQQLLMETPEGQKIPLSILRWDAEGETFRKQELSSPGKPLGP